MTAVVTVRGFAAKNRRAVILLAVGLGLLAAVLVGKMVQSRSHSTTTPPAPAAASTSASTAPVAPATTVVPPAGPTPDYHRNPFATAR